MRTFSIKFKCGLDSAIAICLWTWGRGECELKHSVANVLRIVADHFEQYGSSCDNDIASDAEYDQEDPKAIGFTNWARSDVALRQEFREESKNGSEKQR